MRGVGTRRFTLGDSRDLPADTSGLGPGNSRSAPRSVELIVSDVRRSHFGHHRIMSDVIGRSCPMKTARPLASKTHSGGNKRADTPGIFHPLSTPRCLILILASLVLLGVPAHLKA